MESVSAFSNTCAWSILIGVTDTWNVTGLDVGRRTLEDLAGYIKRNSDPPVYPSLQTVQFGTRTLLSIQVKENPEKPVFFHDKAFRRVGRSNQRISSH